MIAIYPIALTVLILAKEREVEENSEGLSVGSEDDNLRNTTVQSLGSLVGTLLELTGICATCQYWFSLRRCRVNVRWED